MSNGVPSEPCGRPTASACEAPKPSASYRLAVAAEGDLRRLDDVAAERVAVVGVSVCDGVELDEAVARRCRQTRSRPREKEPSSAAKTGCA